MPSTHCRSSRIDVEGFSNFVSAFLIMGRGILILKNLNLLRLICPFSFSKSCLLSFCLLFLVFLLLSRFTLSALLLFPSASAFGLAFSFALLLQDAAFAIPQILYGYLLGVPGLPCLNPPWPDALETVVGVGAVLRFSKSNTTPYGVFNKTVDYFPGDKRQ